MIESAKDQGDCLIDQILSAGNVWQREKEKSPVDNGSRRNSEKMLIPDQKCSEAVISDRHRWPYSLYAMMNTLRRSN